jgi:uncharacterized protein involved in exopolysaccharide biosynthesis
MYLSQATFVPQGAEGSISGLAAAASQLGIRIPAGASETWGPTMYVQVLKSTPILEGVARDTVTVVEEGNRQAAVMDLLEAGGANQGLKLDDAVTKLRTLVDAQEIKTIGAVHVTARSKWPSVSYALARALVDAVNAFNQQTRKSQATAERHFVEERLAEAQAALLTAENNLKAFLNQNRVVVSPELMFQKDRLEREVSLRQQLYASFMQNREEARIREVRDTPVITMIEEPQVPVLGEPRRSIQKGVIGGILAGLLACLVAVARASAAQARSKREGDAAEFLRALDEALPRFSRAGR